MYIIPPALSLIAGWTLAIISIVKGRFRIENILFSLVCVWWSLMPVIYVSHHLFRGNLEIILSIERSIHIFYVYMPFILLLYLWKSFGFRNRFLLALSLVQSIVISAFVPTSYYISGLYVYNWGYSAIGGPAFKIFGASAMFYTVYVIYFFISKIRVVHGATERLKLRYILLSFIATGILMILNMPSILGNNFYAFGNFMFVPLLLIAYGVLRYRLMEIKSILHITLVWIVISSLVIVPNIYIYRFVKPLIINLGNVESFTMLVLWFFINYFYFVRIKPLIDRLFNREKFNLMRNESLFIENVSLLRSVDDLTGLFHDTLRRELSFKSAKLFLRSADDRRYTDNTGNEVRPGDALYAWLLRAEEFIDRDVAGLDPGCGHIRHELIKLFKDQECQYIIPFVYNMELTGIAFIGERANMKTVSPPELRFLHSIRNALSISISNSVMYQNLSDLKDNLEQKVAHRTGELLVAKERSEEMNRQLVIKNSELSEARKIAEMDMQMAVNVQKSIFPQIPDTDPDWDIAACLRPMSGVSGDIYDLYMSGDRLSGMMLLDVSGHGVASGLVTMIARSVFYRNFFMHASSGLGRIMESANGDLIREIGNAEKFITGILLRLYGNIVEYSNAGHPDIIMRKSGNGEVLAVNDVHEDVKGGILGVHGMAHAYDSMKFEMHSGDVLFAFSDGIIEGKGASNGRFGFDGVMRALKHAQAATASGILGNMLEVYDSFTAGEPAGDDLTLLVLVKR